MEEPSDVDACSTRVSMCALILVLIGIVLTAVLVWG